MSRLGYVLPDRPGDSPLDTIPFVLGAADCILGVAEIAADAFELSVAIGLSMEAMFSGPLVTAVGSFMALGAGYDEAKRDIQGREILYGFALGLVMGSDGVTPKKAADYAGHRYFAKNDYLEGGARYAAEAYKLGLLNGYGQGRHLTANQRLNLWRDLLARARPLPGWSDYSGQSEQSKQWSQAKWVDYYHFFGAVFRMFHTAE
jgi:hypothetical protein